jgi:hypothetical protein
MGHQPVCRITGESATQLIITKAILSNVAVTAFKALDYQLDGGIVVNIPSWPASEFRCAVSTAFIKINEVPTFKIEFKSVIEAIDVSSTKDTSIFHAFRHLGLSVPEVFYSAYLQNNVAFRASFL